MQLVSVNLGQPRVNAKGRRTGIFKEPVTHPVRITTLGVVGDAVLDQRHHGGPDQAVYLYGQSDYDWWSTQLGEPLAPGTFGENLTITDFLSAQCAVGDRLHVGDVVLEITSPRIPCGTLESRMGRRGFVDQFIAAERPGAYCRVMREGVVTAGDAVTLEPYAHGERVRVVEMFREFFASPHNEAVLRRHLAAPIGERLRKDHERELAKLQR